MRKLDINDSTIKEASELYNQGNSINETARLMGMTEIMIRRRLNYAGVKRRPVGAEKLPGKISLTALMQVFHCSHQTVKDLVSESGVETTKHGRRVWIDENDIPIVRSVRKSHYALTKVDHNSCGVSSTEMGWLAGVFDGEGSIRVHSSVNDCGASVAVTNTGVPLLRKVMSIFDRLGIGYTLIKGNDPCVNINVKEFQKAWTLLDALHPYLVLKQKEAEIVMEFCRVRSENERRTKGIIRKTAKRLRTTLEEYWGDCLQESQGFYTSIT